MKRFWIILLAFWILKGSLMAIEMKNLSVKGIEIPVIYEQNTQLPLFYVQLVFRGAGAVSNGVNLGLSDIVSSVLNEGTEGIRSYKIF